jgi:hypothetical protein
MDKSPNLKFELLEVLVGVNNSIELLFAFGIKAQIDNSKGPNTVITLKNIAMLKCRIFSLRLVLAA